MKKGPLGVRLLCNLFLEALNEQEDRAKPSRDDDVVFKGYLVDPDKTVEPSVVDVLRELDRQRRERRARHAA